MSSQCFKTIYKFFSIYEVKPGTCEQASELIRITLQPAEPMVMTDQLPESCQALAQSQSHLMGKIKHFHQRSEPTQSREPGKLRDRLVGKTEACLLSSPTQPLLNYNFSSSFAFGQKLDICSADMR